MKVYDFKVILEPDETEGYVVSCPSLPGCHSQGDTVEEALANIKEAIELCIEDMAERGRRDPRPVGDAHRDGRHHPVSSRLPVVSGQEAVQAFATLGYEVVRRKGSHMRLRHPSDRQRKPLTIPDHRTLKPGLLRALIRDANLDVEEFARLLRGERPSR